MSTEDGPREQCSPPRAGDTVWRGDVIGVIGDDGHWRCAQPPTPRPSWRDRLADRLFCTRCFRLRMSPLHLILCDRGRTEPPLCDCTVHDITTPGAAHADDCPAYD